MSSFPWKHLCVCACVCVCVSSSNNNKKKKKKKKKGNVITQNKTGKEQRGDILSHLVAHVLAACSHDNPQTLYIAGSTVAGVHVIHV